MIKIEIYPLIGIKIENIELIKFGVSKSKIIKILGTPNIRFNEVDFNYTQYNLNIFFDENDEVNFFGFYYGHLLRNTIISVYRINPFQIGSEELVKILKEKNNGYFENFDEEYTYLFYNISLGIWKQYTVADIENQIKFAKYEGIYEIEKKYLIQDLEMAKNYWEIGIGKKDFYQSKI
ncbi:hypothetical protein HXZ62_04370 [Empedobacter falsenii]|uniref:hypothetical protein n=1 Tax=Empedobacter falsenii TaxID=343874 RepID=UPI002574F40B|nr:hypothetical protein [Empedobacter falsenii]MDM1061802.1 hypothetical protein [Empedobacter falsenii]